MTELVTEPRHIDNLNYFRELYKLDLDDRRERSENGELVDRDEVMDIIENISVIDKAIAYLHSKVKENEDRFDSKRVERLIRILERFLLYEVSKRKWDYQSGRWFYQNHYSR